MKPLRFYEHFACGYGTIWLSLTFSTLVTRQHLNTGWFGLIGYPIIALIYAFVRKSYEEKESKIIEQITREDVRRYLKKALRIDLFVSGVFLISNLLWILYINLTNYYSMMYDANEITDMCYLAFLSLFKFILYLYIPSLFIAIGIDWYKSLPEKK
jgi:uncharacterized membrane protein